MYIYEFLNELPEIDNEVVAKFIGIINKSKSKDKINN